MPVKTIASPLASAAAMTSSSRIEPPGWITAVAPASAAASRPSAKGKNASEATTEPATPASGHPAASAASRDFHAAMREESMRLRIKKQQADVERERRFGRAADDIHLAPQINQRKLVGIDRKVASNFDQEIAHQVA